MGITNFIVTVAAVGAVIMLARSDVKQSASIFRRNVRHIRNWLEDETDSVSKSAQKAKKEIESRIHQKDSSKGDKH